MGYRSRVQINRMPLLAMVLATAVPAMCLYPLIACQLQRIFIQLLRFITCLLLSLWCLEVVLPPHWYLAPQCYTSGEHLDFFYNIGVIQLRLPCLQQTFTAAVQPL